MQMLNVIKTCCFSNIRVSRKIYLHCTVLNVSLAVIIACLSFFTIIFFSELLGLMILVLIIGPTVAQLMLAVNRLHDADLSGWFVFVGAIPIIGIFFVIALFFIPSDEEGESFSAARL
jgi:uncharacterized membrane protein YhaH (DUF805 family)